MSTSPSFLQKQFTRLEELLTALVHGTKATLTLEEAAKYLGLSASGLYKLTSERRIPHFKPEGKKIYFDRLQLDEWARRNPVRTVEEITASVRQRSR